MWAAGVSTYRRVSARSGTHIAHPKHRSTECRAVLAQAAVIAVRCAGPLSEAIRPCGYHCAQGLAISICGATVSYTQSSWSDSTRFDKKDATKFQDDLSTDDQELRITRLSPTATSADRCHNLLQYTARDRIAFSSSLSIQRPFQVPVWAGGCMAVSIVRGACETLTMHLITLYKIWRYAQCYEAVHSML